MHFSKLQPSQVNIKLNLFVEISYEDFITEFILPFVSRSVSGPKYEAIFNTMPRGEVNDIRKHIYDPFLTCIERENVCRSYKLVLTQNTVDESDHSRCRVNAGLFPIKHAPTDGQPHWESQGLWMEFKRFSEDDAELDPFDKDPESPGMWDISPELRLQGREQLESYALNVLDYQQRHFMFSILILHASARIIRWDKAGVVVTSRFDYKRQPKKLGEFLHLFTSLSPEHQGYDLTAALIQKGSRDHRSMVELAEDGAQKVARGHIVEATPDYIRDAFKKSLDTDRPWWKLTDQWRCDDGDGTTRREGDVLRILNNEGVNHVPTLLCHGDVRDKDEKAQHARTQSFWNELHPQDNLETLIHYRLVEKEVALPTSEFRKGYDLVKIVADCFKGHKEAVEKAGLLHQDISDGNILCLPVEEVDAHGRISTVFRGILCDWELATSLYPKRSGHDDTVGDGIGGREEYDTNEAEDNESGQNRTRRLGTWQFMSVKLLTELDEPATIQDDLESFFYVLLYLGVRYLRNNCPDIALFMVRYFEEHTVLDGRLACGHTKPHIMRVGTISTIKGRQLQFLPAAGQTRHPLIKILNELLSWFKARYGVAWTPNNPSGFSSDSSLPFSDSSLPKRSAAEKEAWAKKKIAANEQSRELATRLKNHDAILELFHRYLSQDDLWPDNDKVGDQLLKKKPPTEDVEVVAGPSKRKQTKPLPKKTRAVAKSSKRKATEVEDLEAPRSKRAKPSEDRTRAVPNPSKRKAMEVEDLEAPRRKRAKPSEEDKIPSSTRASKEPSEPVPKKPDAGLRRSKRKGMQRA
ncbi:hypothetical protein A0H81_11131 [Grifola frondosa]|uniref:Fungal-type protein kinase domain-containing protein n=1 Tax=Grifola frondosa TaxID=5627 RepID=A0A1C7LVC8_GRIFR|nr:hypothetical protein A0H81_11131 [Grifola frondosa]